MDRIERERLLFLYSGALERGDMETISHVLQQAETDPQLGEMILELHTVHLEDVPASEPTTDPRLQILRSPQPDDTVPTRRQMRLSAGLAIAAAAVLAALAFLVILMGVPQINEPVATGVITGRPVLTRHNIDRIVPVERVGRGAVYDLAWSPDGRTLAIASATGLSFYSSDTLQPLEVPSALRMSLSVYAVDYSPDGQQIAFLTRHGIDVIDLVTGQAVQTWNGAFAAFVRFADGRMITGMCEDESLSCSTFDVVLLEGEATQLIASGSNLKPALSDDGSLLATSDSQRIRLWNTTGDFESPLLTLHPPQAGQVKALHFSADGTHISAQVDIGQVENPRSSAGTTVLADALVTWDVSSSEVIQQVTLLDPSSSAFRANPGGGYFVYEVRQSSRDDGLMLEAAPLADGDQAFGGDGLPIIDAAFSQNDDQLTALLADGRIGVWSLTGDASPELTGIIDIFLSDVEQIAFSPVNALLAAASSLRMNVYDFAESDLLHTAQFEADDQPLPTLADNGLAFGPDGALAYADARPSRSSLAFWMPDEGVTYAATGALSVSDATAVTYDSFGALVAYFADGPTLVRRFVDQTDFIVESIALPFDANNAFSRHAVFSPDGMLLAVDGCLSADVRGGSACSDYRIALIESLSGSVLATVSTGFAGPGQGMALGIQADDRRVLLAVSGCMRFSGGTLLDAVCTNETIALWDVTGLTSGATTEPETLTVVDGAGAVAFNADATLLAFANDTQLQVIEVVAGEILLSHSLSGSDGGLAFNSEDTLVAVGSEGTVLLLGLPLD